MALHFKLSPEKLDKEAVEEYLFYCKNLHQTPSDSFFKHTVYGLRSLYKVLNLPDRKIALPQIKRQSDLPIVLNKTEVRELLASPKYLRHKLILALLYGCGLRSYELCDLHCSDVDLERKTVFVRKKKGHTDLEWIQSRENELLNVPYFHVVFTVPHEFNPFCLLHGQEIYKALFTSAWQTIRQFSTTEMDAAPGMIAVLHTWGQNLSLHPHLHCIVPNGGVTKAGNWKQGKQGKDFLFSVRAMSKMYRAKFVAEVRKQKLPLPQDVYNQLFKKEWVVYGKKPFGKPEHVVEYLGRYSIKSPSPTIGSYPLTSRKEKSVLVPKSTERMDRKSSLPYPPKSSSSGSNFIFYLKVLPEYGIMAS